MWLNMQYVVECTKGVNNALQCGWTRELIGNISIVGTEIYFFAIWTNKRNVLTEVETDRQIPY